MTPSSWVGVLYISFLNKLLGSGVRQTIARYGDEAEAENLSTPLAVGPAPYGCPVPTLGVPSYYAYAALALPTTSSIAHASIPRSVPRCVTYYALIDRFYSHLVVITNVLDYPSARRVKIEYRPVVVVVLT